MNCLRNKFNKIKINAKKDYCFKRYSLLNEYGYKPILPAPFIFFSFIIIVFKLLFNFISNICLNDSVPNNKIKINLQQIAIKLNIGIFIFKITNINYDSCNYFLKVDSIDNSQENNALTRLESYAVSELMYHKKKEKFIKEASINRYLKKSLRFLACDFDFNLFQSLCEFISLDALNRKVDVMNERFNQMETNLTESNKLVINYQEFKTKKAKKTPLKDEVTIKQFVSLKYVQDSVSIEQNLLKTNINADPDILSV